jgi:hypothetical protein
MSGIRTHDPSIREREETVYTLHCAATVIGRISTMGTQNFYPGDLAGHGGLSLRKVAYWRHDITWKIWEAHGNDRSMYYYYYRVQICHVLAALYFISSWIPSNESSWTLTSLEWTYYYIRSTHQTAPTWTAIYLTQVNFSTSNTTLTLKLLLQQRLQHVTFWGASQRAVALNGVVSTHPHNWSVISWDATLALIENKHTICPNCDAQIISLQIWTYLSIYYDIIMLSR